MGGKGWRGKRKRAGGKGQGAGADATVREAGDGEGDPAPKRATPARNDIWQEESGNWELSNEQYESYYQRQGVCPPDEWQKLLEALRTGLPVAIRVNRMRVGASSLCARLSEMQAACSPDPSRELYAPQPLTWYPHHLAWQWLGLERRTVKKDKKNARLKDYLMQRERSGLISRQEVVSMIPPLFLDVQPDHLVLDMCAAPGSKTSQMIEVMHWAQSAKGAGRPKGLVLANELQWKRANMLTHQVQRLGSPCTAVTNMDAQFFPELWTSTQDADSAAERRPLRFDRVLCDVPCSGDGTMRKMPYIWRSWTPRDGASLHIRQLGILNRGLELLKVGGRLVYSTCSLNPLEDEAVVAAALQRQGEALALLPPPKLEGFRAARCLERWVVRDPNKDVYYEDYDSVPKESKEGKCKILPSMFPPKGMDAASLEIRQAVRDHCVRLLPHLMDTGGFFVAIFEKRSELRASAKSKREDFQQARREQQASAAAVPAVLQETQPSEGSKAAQPTPEEVQAAVTSLPQAPQGLKKLSNEYIPVDTNGTQWKDISEFYGLEASLAKLFVRRKESDRLFLVSEGVEQLLRSNVKTPTRMALCGVTVFQRAASHHVRACEWQPLQQGLPALVALGLKRRLRASRAFLIRLLQEKELSFSELREATAAGELLGLDILGLAESATVEDLRPGSLAVVLDEERDGRGLPPFALAAVLSDDMLELAAGSAKDIAALLEDLEGQPGVEDILRPPDAAVDEAAAYDADAEAEAAEGAEGTEDADADAEPHVEGDDGAARDVAEAALPQ